MSAPVYLSVSGAGAKNGQTKETAYSVTEFQNAADDFQNNGPGSILYIKDGTYTIDATILFNQAAGTTANLIGVVGTNSDWEDDGTRPIIDADSTAVECFKIDGVVDACYFKNLDLINPVDYCFNHTNSGTSWSIFFYNVLLDNSTGHGLEGQNNMSNSGGAVNCQFSNNTSRGLDEWRNCDTFRCVFNNNAIGFYSNEGRIDTCLIYGNTTSNIGYTYSVMHSIIDGTKAGTNTITGITPSAHSIHDCRITNHSGWGVDNTSSPVLGDNNYFYSNATGDIKFTSGYFPGTNDRLSGVNSDDGYTDASTGNYTLTAGGDGVGVSLSVGLSDEATNIFGITQGIGPLYATASTETITSKTIGVGNPTVVINFPAAAPIFMNIVNEIKRLIPLMTVLNGYQYDYGSVDIIDSDSRTYPASFLEFPDEEGLDEDENVINRYSVTTLLNIKVWAATGSDLDVIALGIRGDYGKMFAANLASLQTKGMELVDYISSTQTYRNVTAYPAEIILTYSIKYRRQKTSPFLT